MTSNPTHSYVRNEGCDLHYWYHGSGPLFFCIPGGNGAGRQFNSIAPFIVEKGYTWATFDRRGYEGSRNGTPHRLNPPQQARDVLTVIKALRFDKATLLGSSLGGMIGFQFALDHGEYVEHLIAHEAPALLLLPDASEMFEYVLGLVELAEREGYQAAAKIWGKSLVGYSDPDMPKTGGQEEPDVEFFWRYETLTASSYMPNLFRLRESGVSIGLMRGIRSGDAFYARSTYEQAKVLGCLRMDVPGHHQGFETQPDDFVPSIWDMLVQLEAKRKIHSKSSE